MSERSVQINVRVFRERGALLSRLAHDLELKLRRVQLTETESRVEVRFLPSELVVTGALIDGVVDSELLGPAKHREIEHNLRTQVLNTKQFPEASFVGSFQQQGDSVAVSGELELVGSKQPLEFKLERKGTSFRACVRLTPSRWGIRPFQALLGALKLQDRVEVLLEVQAD